jgi:branched-chain amino acid transport system substrate-binding protein
MVYFWGERLMKILAGMCNLPFLWGAVLFALLATSCQPRDFSAGTIYIGGLAPLSGPLAATVGQQMVNSADLATRELNAAGGLLVNGRRYRVELAWEDDGNAPDQAASAAQRLINQRQVVAIIGPPFSRTAIAAGTVAENGRVPLISPTATNAELTRNRQYVFRATFVDGLQGQALAHLALEKLGERRAAVLYEISDPYSRGLAEAFHQAYRDLGGEIVAFESYVIDTDDFSPLIRRIGQHNPGVLFLPNHTTDALRQGQLARDLGLEAVLLGGDGWQGELLAPFAAFDGSYYSSHFCQLAGDAEHFAFIQRYREAYNQETTGIVALTYDALQLLLMAVEMGGNYDPDSIRQALYQVEYDGLAGKIAFDGRGDPQKSVPIWQIREGARACYQVYNP